MFLFIAVGRQLKYLTDSHSAPWKQPCTLVELLDIVREPNFVALS